MAGNKKKVIVFVVLWNFQLQENPLQWAIAIVKTAQNGVRHQLILTVSGRLIN